GVRRARIVHFLLTECFLRGQRLESLHVAIGFREAGARLFEIRLRLLQLRARLARIDFAEELPARHVAALFVDAPEEVALDFWSDIRVHITLCRADPLAVDRLVVLRDSRHHHGGWRRRGVLRAGSRASARNGGQYQRKQKYP